MKPFRWFLAVLFTMALLAGCSNTVDTARQKPAEQKKPADNQSKKDSDKSHSPSHEPG
jgi:PBP1b-binding outer membrane lipoprotein LpoB